MLIITDISGATEALTGYTALKRHRNVSGEKTLAFLVLPTSQNAHSFPMVQEESIVEFDGEPFRIKQVSEKPKGATYYKEVVAVHTFFDLIDEYIYGTYTGSKTFDAALQYVFAGTSYTWDIVDTFLAQDWENFGDDNRLALFQSVLKRYGAEFTLAGTHLTFRTTIGNASDYQFRYNYNVKTLNRDVNTNNLSTYIKGYGKQNEDGTYVVQSEYTSPNSTIFGIRHAKPVRDELYTTLAGLNARLQAEIIDEPELSITIDFADMRRAGFPYDVPNEGDDVFLIYEPIGIDVEARIMEIDEEFTEASDLPIKTSVTLANVRASITDHLVDAQKQVNAIVDSGGKVRYNVLDDAVKRATEALQSAQTELEFTNGIIARDKSNPNNLVSINSAGVGISTDGGATFTEAITYLGVNTSVLTAGQINANNISVKGGTDDAYTQIDGSGLYVKKGLATIERDDGFKTMIGGKINQSFNIQGSDPPAMVDVTRPSDSRFYLCNGTITAENGGTCNLYTFTRIARYVIFQVAVMSSLQNAQSSIILVQSGNESIWLANVYTLNTTEDVMNLVVDLGVPDGSTYALKMMLKSWQSDNTAYCRAIRYYQSDFLPS